MPQLSSEQEAILNYSKQILSGAKKLSLSGTFGKGFSERFVETPWAASHLKDCGSFLDIGFTFASFEYLGLLLELKDRYGVMLNAADIIEPEKVRTRYPQEWLKSILEVPVSIGDIRSMVLPKGKFDAVTCISTIEHIGFDEPARTVKNSAFERRSNPKDVQLHRDPNVNAKVLDNVRNSLKPKGKLLISVPMGKGGPALLRDSLGFYCAQWEYEEKSWNEITANKGYNLLEQRFFRMGTSGWTEVPSPKEVADRSSYMKPHAEGCALCLLSKI